MNKKNVLIFPCNIESGTLFIAHARALNAKLIFASSVSTEIEGEIIHTLPYVNEDKFSTALLELIEAEDIGYIYSEHDVVLKCLHVLLEKPLFKNKFFICNDFPHKVNQQKYGEALDFGTEIIDANETCENLLTKQKYANLFLQFNAIPGMSDNEKLKSLILLFNKIPKGDVIEIGSYWGRSAYALGFLAQHHNVGSVISVDPWDIDSIASQGVGTEIVDETALMIDWEAVHSGYLVAVSGLQNINYIRKPADEAIDVYRAVSKTGELITNELGVVPVCGEIALLHIDGNHKYEQVKKDIELWLPYVKNGGWVLIDDYEWSFGDGPKRAGDELLNDARVAEYFSASDTLFIRLH